MKVWGERVEIRASNPRASNRDAEGVYIDEDGVRVDIDIVRREDCALLAEGTVILAPRLSDGCFVAMGSSAEEWVSDRLLKKIPNAELRAILDRVESVAARLAAEFVEAEP